MAISKTILAMTLLSIPVMSCGILEFLSEDDVPQRYIERQVEDAEVIGNWQLVSGAEVQVNDYVEQADLPKGIVPWKTLLLDGDGTCQVEIEIAWIFDSGHILKEADTPATCTWHVKDVWNRNSTVPGVGLRFEHFNDLKDSYEVYYSDLYIVEEEGELILWSYIGEAYASRYQDFRRIQE
ncbi:MAG: hypothetical protein JXB07_10745 [Anaerolineae bacterium]|nr:hypothetical protein [Anaerolineae bacterium]